MDEVIRMCLSCAEYCSAGRDSYADCQNKCPGYGLTKKPHTTTTTTTTTSSPTTALKDPAGNSDKSDADVGIGDGDETVLLAALESNPENQDGKKMIFGQNVMITLIATLIAICLLALFGLITYKTRLHTKTCKKGCNSDRNPSETVTYSLPRNEDLNTVLVMETEGFVSTLRSDQDGSLTSDSTGTTETTEIQHSATNQPQPNGLTSGLVSTEHIQGPNGVSNPNYESSYTSNRTSDPGHTSDPTSDPGYGSEPAASPPLRYPGYPVLQSCGLSTPSPNMCVFHPEPVFGRTAGGALVGIPDDDSEDDRNTSLKEFI